MRWFWCFIYVSVGGVPFTARRLIVWVCVCNTNILFRPWRQKCLVRGSDFFSFFMWISSIFRFLIWWQLIVRVCLCRGVYSLSKKKTVVVPFDFRCISGEFCLFWDLILLMIVGIYIYPANSVINERRYTIVARITHNSFLLNGEWGNGEQFFFVVLNIGCCCCCVCQWFMMRFDT